MTKELQKLYKEYNQLLIDEIRDLAAIASLHGWKSSRAKEGKALREEIQELERLEEGGEMKWFDKWYDLFPEGVKNMGKPIKQDKGLCERKMKAFIIKYGYHPEVIIKATEQYLNERAAQNYAFTMLSGNFISHREKGSLLAELCEEALKNKPKENINHSYANQDLI